MLYASEDGEGDEPSVLRWRFEQFSVGLRDGMCCLRRTCTVVESDEFSYDSSNMNFAQEDEMIQGVFTKRPVETLDVGIRIRRSKGSRYSLDVDYLIEPKIEVAAITFPFRAGLCMSELPEDSIVVVDQELR